MLNTFIEFLSTPNDNYIQDGTISLKERMQEYLFQYNNKSFNFYKTHVISLKSSEILRFLNVKNTFLQKIKEFKIHNEILLNVSEKLRIKFNPTLIYCFNDEIHLVFAEDDIDKELYNGNINKTLASISTFASVLFTKEFLKQDIDLDFTIIPKYIEFNIGQMYEILNYIIWRQNDCLRNNLSTLFKYFEKDLDNIKITEIAHKLTNYEESKFITDQILYGNLIKNDFLYNIHLINQNFDEMMIKFINI